MNFILLASLLHEFLRNHDLKFNSYCWMCLNESNIWLTEQFKVAIERAVSSLLLPSDPYPFNIKF